MIDPTEFGKAMGAIVRAAVEPLERRIEELETREPQKGEPGKDGADGASPSAEDLAALVAEQVRAAVDALPKPQDGRDGKDGQDGKDASEVDVAAVEDAVVSKLLGSERVDTLVDLAATKAVGDYFEANPVQHGRDGKDGEPGASVKGEPGKDGIGLADALIDRDGALVLTMTDGRAKALGVVVGSDGAAGKDGRDGLSMADVAREYDAEAHEIVERWTVAGEAKELRYPAGGIRPGGFYREGMKCHALQAITHDGALWIAKRDTTAKPCLENADDWQLAARKGRDGRDGKDGKPPPGPISLGGGNG
jgi:hypothetical protein